MKYIASSDLFVFPSRFEGSPNALLEALSCGIPCLGSDIKEIREILSYPDLLFSLENEKELCSTIMRAVTGENFYEKLRTMSKERCSAYIFDWNKKAIDMICS
jgi:glycosyltransferase involved in cell wall biosynthesis